MGPEIERGLSIIIRHTPRYQEQLLTYFDSERIFNATASVFAHIVCYIVNVKALLARRDWKRVLKSSFSNKLNQILSNLENLDKALDREIAAGDGARKSSSTRITYAL